MTTHTIAIGAAPSGDTVRHVPSWRRDWLTGTLLAWPMPLALLAIWYLAARYEWVPPQVLPAPDTVLTTLLDLHRSGELWANLQISALRVAGGFAVGLAGGLALGAAMGLSPRFRDYVYPTFKAFSQVPVLGWLSTSRPWISTVLTIRNVERTRHGSVPCPISAARPAQCQRER